MAWIHISCSLHYLEMNVMNAYINRLGVRAIFEVNDKAVNQKYNKILESDWLSTGPI